MPIAVRSRTSPNNFNDNFITIMIIIILLQRGTRVPIEQYTKKKKKMLFYRTYAYLL